MKASRPCREVAAGVHAAPGRAGAATPPAPDPPPRRCGAQRQVEDDGGADLDKQIVRVPDLLAAQPACAHRNPVRISWARLRPQLCATGGGDTVIRVCPKVTLPMALGVALHFSTGRCRPKHAASVRCHARPGHGSGIEHLKLLSSACPCVSGHYRCLQARGKKPH